jgi:hypothetical protein
MNIKDLILEHYPDSKHASEMKFAKLLDDRFIYAELNDGSGTFYEIKKDRLYVYKRHEVNNLSDNKKWFQIFRSAKLNQLLNKQ